MPALGPRGEPIWTEDELELDRQLAIQHFIDRRLDEGSTDYIAAFDELEPIVQRLLSQSNALRNLQPGLFSEDPSLIDASRYTTGPPISADDLETIAGGSLDVLQPPAERLQKAIAVLEELIDPYRFPWVSEGRMPTADEIRIAVRWTTSLWCVQRVQTSRRVSSSIDQQRLVEQALENAGWTKHDIGIIRRLEDLPIQSFADESRLANEKCDIRVRLLNGQLAAIECKVSNSSVNSIKRLNREVGQKASSWRSEFGRQIIPVAVIAGVFRLVNLVNAQNSGIVLFFDHRLDDLMQFITSKTN